MQDKGEVLRAPFKFQEEDFHIQLIRTRLQSLFSGLLCQEKEFQKAFLSEQINEQQLFLIER